MKNRKGDDCVWHLDPEATARLESLQSILNCASVQGCDDCVNCSEKALDLFRAAARNHGGHPC